MQNYDTVNILMVEDDSLDVQVFKRSLSKHKIANPLFVAKDGQDALEKLQTKEISKPLIIILDLNMPRMNGIEFLAALREDEDYKDSIVFVMTTSDADADKIEAYNYNVAGYMVKSELGQNFLNAIDMLDRYWKTIQLPTT